MLRDLRYAIRVLLQAKGWSAVVLVSLALGIGANTALFSGINALLVRTLAVHEPEGLVRLYSCGENDMARSRSEYGFTPTSRSGEDCMSTFSYPMFENLRAANQTMSGMFACAPFSRVNVVVDGQAEIASAFLASGGYFGVLGVQPAAGRAILPADDEPTAPPVAMISYGYWKRRFGSDPDTIGSTVTINGKPFTIVGVTPAGYLGVQSAVDTAADVHLPLVHNEALGGGRSLEEATTWWLQVVGRLEPGITAAQVEGNLQGTFQASARSGMETFLAGLTPEERSQSRNQDRTDVPHLEVSSASRGIYDADPDTRRDAVLLSWVVALVLLIVCANVANLLLSRAAAREREISVRLSVGATRTRLIRQLITEGVFLALLGGALGLLVAYWARRLLPFASDAPFDWRLFGFVAALSLATGVLFSLVPAFRTTGVDLSSSLKGSGRGIAGSRGVLSRGLLVVQVAVSLVLVTGAGLFLGTLRNLRSVPVGFDPANLLLFRVDPTLSGYEQEELPAFYGRLRERLEAVPGVESVSLSQTAFLSGSVWMSSVHLPGRAEGVRGAHMMTVSPEFFETMRIPLLDGREFDQRDSQEGPRVAVLNATGAREMFGNDRAVGRRFGFSPEEPEEIEVIGVVRDTKYVSVRQDAPTIVYRSHLQDDVDSMVFELRTGLDPRGLVPSVREAVRTVDANLPLMDISTQEEQIERRFRQERFFARAYSLFGGLATLLAAVGLFGLASYSVARRTNEIGVRMALGARGGDIFRLILGESLRLVGVGVILGLVTALAAGRFVQTMLFGVVPADAPTLAVAVAVLALVAILASYLPARRAARVDPMKALQYE